MKAAGVDTIVVWAQGTPTGHLLRSMEKINYFPLFLSSWAADNKSFFDAAGSALAERPIFMRTITDDRSATQQKLLDRISARLASPTAFAFTAHGYDAMMLFAEAAKQAGSVDGPKVREALESLKAPYEGFMKTYKAPFSATEHEALTTADFKWAHWKDGKLLSYSDDVIKGLTLADFKK
jgi:branched-chain amino acid transport system substrate-binding protein